jgi:hypothetical protein
MHHLLMGAMFIKEGANESSMYVARLDYTNSSTFIPTKVASGMPTT